MRSKDYFSMTIQLLMLFVTANILVFSLAAKMTHPTSEVQQQEIQRSVDGG